jgi:hypothetical protein
MSKGGIFTLVVFAGISALWGVHSSKVMAHQLSSTIAECDCSSKCFTAETSSHKCNRKTFSFKSHGLPNKKHVMMKSIKRSNQQFPFEHNYSFTFLRNPTLAKSSTATEPGAIGVAVNGVPIFNPETQGEIDPTTGRRPTALEQGELDQCGGHAGRGDDYHYHISPKCLIKELGRYKLEVKKQPIGFAADGFPILALGWFNKVNNIENRLDACRGIKDAAGKYFYNVQSDGNYDVLNCFSGTRKSFAKDFWERCLNKDGKAINGVPIKFSISASYTKKINSDDCQFMVGKLSDRQVKHSSGVVSKVTNKKGTLFYCNQGCYGHFSIIKTRSGQKGRTIEYDLEKSNCPSQVKPKEFL